MTKRKVLILSALLILILMFSAVFGCSEKKQEQEEQTLPPVEDVQPDVTDKIEESSELEGDVSVEIESNGSSIKASDGTTVVVTSIATPKIASDEYAAGAEIINKYYADQKEKHISYAEFELYEYAIFSYTNYRDDFTAFRTEQFFTVKYNDNGYLSVLRFIVDSVGDQTSSMVTVAETFELKSGGLVTGNYAFSDGEKPVVELITDKIKEQIAQDKNTVYYDGYEERVDSCFDIDNFYLSEEGVVFFFKTYELADASQGMPEYIIPYDEIKEVFNLW